MDSRLRPRPMLTRRDILAAGVSALAAAALGPAARAADETFPFKLGLQSYSLRNFKFEEALKKTRLLGLGFWESFSAHTPIDVTRAEYYRDQAEAKGVTIAGFGVSHFTKDHDANRKIFEFGSKLGVKYLSADPDKDSFDSLDKLVEEYNLTVGIHNHGPGHQYATIDGIAAAIKDHSPKIGCCIDTGHFLRSNEDPVRAVEVFDKRIYGVHLKDVVKGTDEFKILGKGSLDTPALLKALAKRKYGYTLAIEYEEKPEDPIADIQTCIEVAVKSAKGL